MKKVLKKIGVAFFTIAILFQAMGAYAAAGEPEDIDLNSTESILEWIEENIPEDLNELPQMPQEWWDSLLPNQRQVAENLAIPAINSGEYALSPTAYMPESGDAVAKMKLSSTGITDGYGKTLWKISNGGSNVFCLDHGKSCKSSYNYGNFQKMSGSVAFLIEKYGQSSTVSGYIAIQMAIWALQSASTEEEAYAYAYTWYQKSYSDSEAATWAKTSMQFYRLAKGKNGTIWKAEGPSGSQSVGKYQEFVTTPYSGEGGGEVPEEPGVTLVEPEFEQVEDSIEVTYKVHVKKADWQTEVGLQGCIIDIFENGSKVATVTTDENGEASYETSKSESFSAEYCSNYDELTPEQQAEITCFTSWEEAESSMEAEMDAFADSKYTYSSREVTAPSGYVWQANEHSVSISGNEEETLYLTNERTLGAVELLKYDTESESLITQGDARTLDGAVYGIYAAEDIVHQDQKTGVLYEKDTLVQTAVTGKTPKRNQDGYVLNVDGSRHIENPKGSIAYEETPGKTLFGDLELGSYYMKEISPANGYMLDETVYEVTFTYQDQMVKIETRDELASEDENTLHLDDERESNNVHSGDYVIKQGIQFVKTSDNAYQTELKPIKGAGFSVYLISELSHVKSGALKPQGDHWSFDDVMTFYDYDFTEESRAVLYKRKDETWTDGDKKWLIKEEGDRYAVAEMFTDEDGRIETPELPFGTYVIAETTTPENHVSAKPFIVYITKDGGVLYTDRTKQNIEKTYTAEEAIRYGDHKETLDREGRLLQKQRIINNTITKTFLRVVKADEEFLAEPGTYIKAEEMVRGTVLKEDAKYRLRCLSMGLSEESLKALNWKYDQQGFLSYYDPNAKNLTGTIANPFVTTFAKKEGNITDSYITLPQEIPVGAYELVELMAPTGYVLNGYEQQVVDKSSEHVNGYEIINTPKEKVLFTIGNGAVYPDGQMGTNKYALYDQFGNLTVTVLQKNQEQKGIVEIYKHGEQLANVSSEKHFIYEDAPIEGAKFQIIAEEDIYTQELDKHLLENYVINESEYLLHKKGDVIAEVTTDRSGWAYVADLYIGKYKIIEIEAGEGFTLNKKEETFEITPQEQKVSFDYYFSDYKNERQKIEIGVLKKDQESGDVLSGALYGLYAAEDIFTGIEYLAEDDKWVVREEEKLLVSKDTLLAIATTNENGQAVFAEDLPLGIYYVKELEAPKGYLLNETPITIDASYGSKMGGQDVETQIHSLIFENEREKKVDVEKSTDAASVKPGQEYRYTIDEVKNCLNESMEEFTLTDILPKQVRLVTLSTGTYNQKLTYRVEYQTNQNAEWRIWQEQLDTEANYYLVLPKDMNEGEYVTAFRFCFGTVGGLFEKEISPEYRVKVIDDAAGEAHNEVTLTAVLAGEPVEDKDETDTPVKEPKPDGSKDEKPSEEEEKQVEEEAIQNPGVIAKTGDIANPLLWGLILLAAGIVMISTIYYKKKS